MTVVMKYFSRFTVLALTGCLAMASCTPAERSYEHSSTEASDSVIDASTKAKVNTAEVDMDGREKSFILSSYSHSLYMVDLASITAQSKNSELRKFGDQLGASYQGIVTSVEKMAKNEGLLMQRQLSAAQQKELSSLKELSSPTLDQQSLQKINQMLSTFTTVFKEGSHLQNEELKNFANAHLPEVQKQQAMAVKLIAASTDSGTQSTRPGEVSTGN
jgi:predicted outer membrane protein